jgi:hypothetical protein
MSEVTYLARITECKHGAKFTERHRLADREDSEWCSGGTTTRIKPDYEAAARKMLWWTSEVEWEDIEGEGMDPIIVGQAASIVDAALGGTE